MTRYIAACVLAVVLLLAASAAVNPSLAKEKKETREVKQDKQEKDGQFIKPYQDPGQPEEQKAPSFFSRVATLIGNVVRYLLVIALAVGLSYLAVYGLRNYAFRSVASNSGLVKIVTSTYLGPNKALHLIDVAGKVILVSSTSGQINMLTELDDMEQLEKVRQAGESKTETPPFTDVLSRIGLKGLSGTKGFDRDAVILELKDSLRSAARKLKSRIAK